MDIKEMNQINASELLNCAFCEIDDLPGVSIPRFSISTMYDEESCNIAENAADMILTRSKEPGFDGVFQAIVAGINYLSDKYNMESIDSEFIFALFIKSMHEQISETAKSITNIIMDISAEPKPRVFTTSPSGKIIYLNTTILNK